jgi:murein endopeptidase
MPDGFERFGQGTIDIGGDDWASRGAYNWLAANKNLITRINDISGEHGRNIGHSSHKHGTDIDMFHFYTFQKGASGKVNYSQLIENVVSAKNTDSDDQNKKEKAEAAKFCAVL